MTVIEARGLRKVFGATVALDGVNLRVEEGRILGLIGPNGAGKSTALNAILGLTQYQGELSVLGRDPWTERDQLMCDVCFIADVAVLPRWMRVSQALDYVAGVHPRFDRAKAEGFLGKTDIRRTSKIRELSKGMVTQLHLSLVMAIDAKLLVLDEPTPLSQAVLRFPPQRLFRSKPHNIGDDTSGGRRSARPHRSYVHQPRAHRPQL
jgi:ABC-2 type transport system ATP-binding protein